MIAVTTIGISIGIPAENEQCNNDEKSLGVVL